MHVGRNGKRSKTEVLCCPTRMDPINEEFEVTEGGMITFTDSFKYLGSYISKDLKDDINAEKRIQAAGKAFGAIRHRLFRAHGLRSVCFFRYSE